MIAVATQLERASFDRTTMRWRRTAVVVWVIAMAAISGRLMVESTIRHTVFDAFRLAGRNWVAGGELYGDWDHLFRWSPTAAVWFVPFSLLPERAGEIVWRLFNVLILFVGLGYWMRVCTPELGKRATAMMALIVFPMAMASVNNGQANALLTGVILWSLAAVERRNWWTATLLITFATVLKVYPLAFGLLLALIHPRQFRWRLPAALVLAFACPFLFQNPGYVADQYGKWVEFLSGDLRLEFPLLNAYRDFWHLTRLVGEPLTQMQYKFLQLGSALALAAACLWTGRLGWSNHRRTGMALFLGMCWCMLLGPSTESCTYTMMAPLLGWALLDPARKGEPSWSRVLLLLAALLYASAEIGNLFPGAALVHAFGPQPLATLALAIRFVATGLPGREPAAGRRWAIQTTSNAQAA